MSTLLPSICQYSYENEQDGRLNADVNWPVLLFLNLGVSHDMVARILQHMFEAQEVPFRGPAARARLAEWITVVLGRWATELGRRGAAEAARLDPWVAELAAECEAFVVQVANGPGGARVRNPGGLDPRDVLRNLREAKKTIDSFVAAGAGPGGMMGGPAGMGSLRGSLGFF